MSLPAAPPHTALVALTLALTLVAGCGREPLPPRTEVPPPEAAAELPPAEPRRRHSR
ncbi:MAG: hypothetical protein IPG81_13555 [Sandaracinaceae bacterium]|nr:hypothetical protein [Sandaracinaceae bacterium]